MGSLMSSLKGLGRRLASAEVDEGRAPVIARCLIECAVLRLPQEEQSRWLEEWLAHLNDIPGSFGKLFHSIGCLRAAGKIAVVPVPVARTVEKRSGGGMRSGNITTETHVYVDRKSNLGPLIIIFGIVLGIGGAAFLAGFFAPVQMQVKSQGDFVGRLVTLTDR